MGKSSKEIKYTIASNRSFLGASISTPKELLKKFSKKKGCLIFFPFWSWIIPESIVDNHTCIGFHSAPLPMGRGGSPIQNMIRLDNKSTELCMFKITSDLDGGSVLAREAIDITGTLEDILERLKMAILDMIDVYNSGTISKKSSRPSGVYKTADKFIRIVNNVIPECDNLSSIYDEIRMRDARNHPKACKFHGKFVIEFTDAKLEKDCVSARVKFIQR